MPVAPLSWYKITCCEHWKFDALLCVMPDACNTAHQKCFHAATKITGSCTDEDLNFVPPTSLAGGMPNKEKTPPTSAVAAREEDGVRRVARGLVEILGGRTRRRLWARGEWGRKGSSGQKRSLTARTSVGVGAVLARCSSRF